MLLPKICNQHFAELTKRSVNLLLVFWVRLPNKCAKSRIGLLKTIRIGAVRIDNPIVLAPMSGVTDMPQTLVKAGAGLVVSEMIASLGPWYTQLQNDENGCSFSR